MTIAQGEGHRFLSNMPQTDMKSEVLADYKTTSTDGCSWRWASYPSDYLLASALLVKSFCYETWELSILRSCIYRSWMKGTCWKVLMSYNASCYDNFLMHVPGLYARHLLLPRKGPPQGTQILPNQVVNVAAKIQRIKKFLSGWTSIANDGTLSSTGCAT